MGENMTFINILCRTIYNKNVLHATTIVLPTSVIVYIYIYLRRWQTVYLPKWILTFHCICKGRNIYLNASDVEPRTCILSRSDIFYWCLRVIKCQFMRKYYYIVQVIIFRIWLGTYFVILSIHVLYIKLIFFRWTIAFRVEK